MQTQNKKPAPTRRKARRQTSQYTKVVIRWLVFCFPAGLLMMWSDRCRWSQLSKSLVSVFFAFLVMGILLPQTLPPERAKGGVELVSLVPVAEVQGPVQQEGYDSDFDVYITSYVKPTSVIVEPTPTPVPVYVYCNNGGKYYHNKNCRYVKDTSARVTLNQALDAGYSNCKECNAPKES